MFKAVRFAYFAPTADSLWETASRTRMVWNPSIRRHRFLAMQDVLQGLSTKWGTVWEAFGNADPLVNAIELATILITIRGALRVYVRRKRLADQKHIEWLEAEVAERNQTIASLKNARDAAQAEVVGFERRLPSAALDEATKERELGNDQRADAALREWLDREGDTIAELLMHRARWAAVHAVGETPEVGLAAAHGYATAATVFDPQSNIGVALADEINTLQRREGQWVPSLDQALRRFDDDNAQRFDLNEAEEADRGFAEARRLQDAGLYHLALSQAERAAAIYSRTLGSNARRTVEAQITKSQILAALSRLHEALALMRAAAAAFATHTDAGPQHPDTLVWRGQIAVILRRLGRFEEALREAQPAAAALAAHPARGREHSHTLTARENLAEILRQLGRFDEALREAQAAADGLTAHPAFGREHPNTLAARGQVAASLNSLGRFDEALREAQPAAAALAAHPARGPEHPDTLNTRASVAVSLRGLGRFDEALREAQAAANGLTAHPAFGPEHPNTLAVRGEVALSFHSLGRFDEALGEAQSAAAALAAHPAHGPEHPDTLELRRLVATLTAVSADNE